MEIENKPKLLFFVEAMGGGVFTYIVDLSNVLVSQFDVYIVYGVRSQTPKDYKNYFKQNIHLIESKYFKRKINPINDYRAYIEMKTIANEIKPDIIHLHSSIAGVLGRWAFNGNNIPMFYTPHGYSFLMEDQKWYKRTLFLAIERICGKRTCTTISCSLGEHKESEKLVKNAVYINNGIDMNELTELMQRKKDINNNQSFTVFTLGRICNQKNPRLFNAIAAQLPDIQFLWIGDGELREQLTSPNIMVTGWVDRNQAITYSMQGTVFMLPSLWEGLPISLLECMYLKKLCIVSNVIGNRDVIQDGANGYICNSIDDYVNKIKLARSECQQSLIDKAFQDIKAEYNTEVMAEKYSKQYMNVLHPREKKKIPIVSAKYSTDENR